MKEPYDLYAAHEIKKILEHTGTKRTLENPQGVARPVPYCGIINRIRLAWKVLRYKADAFIWF